MAYEMNWEPRGLHRRYSGVVSDSEVLDSVRATHSSRQFDELRYVIVDFSGIDTFILTSDSSIADIAAIDWAAALTNPLIKIAVVTRDPEIHDLAIAYIEDPLCSYPTRIFSDLAEARKWAAVPLPPEYDPPKARPGARKQTEH